VKIVYRKENYKLLKHFIIEFEPKERVDCLEASEIAWEFIQWLSGGEYQIVFAVHTDTNNIHVHVVLNTTNIITSNSYNEYFEAEKINKIINNIMKARIRL